MVENNLHIRPNYIDFAKIIGMFLVIFAHYYYFCYYYQGPKLATNSLLYSIHAIQLFHMPLFFVISGFLYKGISSYKEELTKIWKTLCVPYALICWVAIASFYILRGGFSWHKLYYTIICFITGYDLPNRHIDAVCDPMWFVYALMIIRLLNMVIRKYKYILYLAILSGVIIMHCGNCLPFRLDSAFVGFLFFTIGCYGKKWISLFVDAKWWQKGIVIMLSMFILILVGCVSDDFNDINQSFSINAMRFGKYPLLFLFSGVAGTIIILLLGRALAYIHIYIHTYIHTARRLSIVQTLSTGMIVTLGFHKLVLTLILALHLPQALTIPCAVLYALATYGLTYIIIELLQKYLPIAIGRR